MANDYGKPRSQAPKGRTFKNRLMVVVAFFCGYLSSLLMDAGSLSALVKSTVITHFSTTGAPKPVTRQQAQIPKPKLEFYTLLTHDKKPFSDATRPLTPVRPSAPTPFVANKTPSANPHIQQPMTASASNANNKELFLVQVASFKNQEDAERMKAALTLKGFNVNVATVNQQQLKWYRVIVGPFASRTQAEKAQLSVAKSEHITGMIRKMDT